MDANIESIAEGLFRKYLPKDHPILSAEIRRIAFQVRLIASHLGTRITACDIGGGWGYLSACCSALGMKSILVDDFMDKGFMDKGDPRYKMLQDCSVQTICRDVASKGVEFADQSIDTFTIIDTLEHWHSSPKLALHQMMKALKPGGLMMIGVPNCVNLRKRITVPFGFGSWTPLSEWYEEPVFRSHVREMDVKDLKYIANDLCFESRRILGRNWAGLSSASSTIRLATSIVDYPLRLIPSLCSDLYLIGIKSTYS